MQCSDEYFDLQQLKKFKLPIDRVIDFVVKPNEAKLKLLAVKNRALPDFYNVTYELVVEFRRQAMAHVQHVLENLSEYGHLYDLLKRRDLFNAVYYDYRNFPLACERVLDQVENMADKFFKRGAVEFPATCLYLLYFYARLANPDKNWITIDHLSNGNVYHKYFMLTRATKRPPEKKRCCVYNR